REGSARRCGPGRAFDAGQQEQDRLDMGADGDWRAPCRVRQSRLAGADCHRRGDRRLRNLRHQASCRPREGRPGPEDGVRDVISVLDVPKLAVAAILGGVVVYAHTLAVSLPAAREAGREEVRAETIKRTMELVQERS